MKHVGEILVGSGVLPWEALDKALKEQAALEVHIPIGQFLIQKQLITEKDLVKYVPPEKLFPHLIGARVLVIEDTTPMRLVMTKMLEQAGAVVEKTHDGKEGLRLLMEASKAGEDFRLVVLDLMMPGMNGVDVLLRIRGTAALKSIPVVIVSAKSEQGAIVECMRYGICDYILKPFTMLQFLERLHEGLKQHLAFLEKLDFELSPAHPCMNCELLQCVTQFLRENPGLKQDPTAHKMLEEVKKHLASPAALCPCSKSGKCDAAPPS